MTEPLLAVRGVKSFYGNIMALKGVDLEVNEGEIVTLIGANGAGKSTLMMTIFGTPQAFPAFSGFILGYLTYDYMHYHLHHHVPKTSFGKRLRTHHMRHHFQDHRYGFGVSSPLWDAIMGTLPRRRQAPSGRSEGQSGP